MGIMPPCGCRAVCRRRLSHGARARADDRPLPAVEIEGVPHRLYFEEAGQGIPLVCLHTAGADNRQFRHLLNDPEVTQRFRVWPSTCRGTASRRRPMAGGGRVPLDDGVLHGAVRAFCRALELDRPVVMGCSIGGRIVLYLAIAHAAEFRALIALEAADFQQPWYDTAWLHRPDVHGARSALPGLGPDRAAQPDRHRHETLWMYMQGGPGVFKGDLYFYRVDGDLRER